jgi:phosphoglycolate phosphatase
LGANVVDLAHHVGVSRTSFFTECGRDFGALELYSGVRQTLDRLRNRSLPLGVVSSLPGPLVEGGLGALELSEMFEAVIHAGNCRVAKPNPKPILQCLSWMAITASRSVYYVGDRDVDQRAAESAGISFAWAAYGYGDGEIPTDVRIDKFEELLRL